MNIIRRFRRRCHPPLTVFSQKIPWDCNFRSFLPAVLLVPVGPVPALQLAAQERPALAGLAPRAQREALPAQEAGVAAVLQ